MQPQVDKLHCLDDGLILLSLLRCNHSKHKEGTIMTCSEKLLKLRKEKGMSQEDLAGQLNTSRQAVSK